MVTLSPAQVQFIQHLDTEFDDLLDQSREDILRKFGKPFNSRRYSIRGEEREQMTYYVVKPGFESEPKTLDIYFKDGIVTGFNMFDGVVQNEEKPRATLGKNISLGGV